MGRNQFQCGFQDGGRLFFHCIALENEKHLPAGGRIVQVVQAGNYFLLVARAVVGSHGQHGRHDFPRFRKNREPFGQLRIEFAHGIEAPCG